MPPSFTHPTNTPQSYCNLPIPDPGRLRNPPLTPKGISQAQALSKHFPHQRTINAVLCSPLQRTLETALTALDSSAPPFKIIAYPNLREYGRCAGNTGAGLAELKEEMDVEGKRERVDLGLVGEGWEKELDTGWKEMRERARRVRQELWELGCMVMGGGEGMWKGIEVGGRESEEGSKQVEIVVVSHGTFLSELVRTAKGKGMCWEEMRCGCFGGIC